MNASNDSATWAEPMRRLAAEVRAAARALAKADTAQKNAALAAAAEALSARKAEIQAANEKDLARGRENGMPAPKLDRLRLTDQVLTRLTDGLRYASNMLRQRAVVFLISDFLTDPEDDEPFEHALRRLAAEHDVVPIRLTDPAAVAGERPGLAAACARIRAAMIRNPELVAGSGRACSLIMAAAPNVMVKTGAEGVYVAALPDRKLGLALKVSDGASRAAVVAVMGLLSALGALDRPAAASLADLGAPLLRNHAGRVVGRITCAPDWPGFAPHRPDQG